ncbi:Imm50 family immunity protein [Streptomyces sp. NPDC002758]
MGADWQQILAAPEYLGELYGTNPPPQDACDLFYVHIDERDNSVTLGIGTREFPVNPRPEWQDKGLNAFEFYLVFTDVTGLGVTGWGAEEAKEMHVTVGNGGTWDVVLGSERSGIHFQASAAQLRRPRAYLASDSP